MQSLSAGRFWALFLVLLAVTVYPLLHAELPPILDYPNHLARMHVLIDQPRSDALQQYYEIRWRPLPNLAMDLTVPLMARVMPLAWAGKAFILLCLVLLSAGPALLHRVVTGRWSIWPLFAFLFLYTHLLIWGFLNYLFGLGLALLALALWLALAERPAALRVAAAAASALVLFFAHLMACAIFGLLIAGHQLGEVWRRREFSARQILTRAVAVGLPFVIPLAILVADGLVGTMDDIGSEGLARKLMLLPMFEGHLPLDIVTTVALLIIAGVGYVTAGLTVVPTLRGPLIMLALAFLLAPEKLMTADGVEDRLPLAFALTLVAATRSSGLATHLKRLRAIALAGLALFLARTGAMEADCALADRTFPKLIAFLDQVPYGGRLAVAFRMSDGTSGLRINHLPTITVLRRDAFVPSFFAYETQQPVILTPGARALREAAEPGELWAAVMAGGAGEAQAREALAGFDALVVLDPWPFTVPATPLLEPVGVEPTFALYRVVH